MIYIDRYTREIIFEESTKSDFIGKKKYGKCNAANQAF